MAFTLRHFECLRVTVSISNTSQNLLCRSARPLQFPRLRLIRSLTTTRQLTAKKTQTAPSRIQTASKVAARAIPTAKANPTTYKTYAETLNSRPSPTLLYQAPSPALYVIGCYTLGGFCITYGAYNFWANYLHPYGQPPAWVPIAFGAIALATGVFGCYVLYGTYRLVRTITAIPTPGAGLRLKIDSAAVLPGIRPRSVTVLHNDPLLATTFYIAPVKLSVAEQVELYKRQEAQREIEKSRILTLPFRQASYWTWRGFSAAKKTFTREGFIYMRVRGYNLPWKVDRDAAWALDEGRALDRLVRHDGV